jgi:hypothetical protein
MMDAAHRSQEGRLLTQSPMSLPPGAGAECSKNLRSATDTSVNGAAALFLTLPRARPPIPGALRFV